LPSYGEPRSSPSTSPSPTSARPCKSWMRASRWPWWAFRVSSSTSCIPWTCPTLSSDPTRASPNFTGCVWSSLISLHNKNQAIWSSSTGNNHTG
jgi:hypothetical protein